MKGLRQGLITLVILGLGCRDDKVATDTASWWETAEETQTSDGTSSTDDEDKPEDEDEDKPEDDDYAECGADFDPTQSCEGGWMDTLCMHEGVIWWCQDGEWLNEEDK